MRFYLIILMGAVLAGCQSGGIGKAESPVWFETVGPANIQAHFKNKCLGYGYPEGDPRLADCIAQETRTAQARAQSTYQNSMATLQTQQHLNNQRQIAQQQAVIANRPVYTNCTASGNNMSCQIY